MICYLGVSWDPSGFLYRGPKSKLEDETYYHQIVSFHDQTGGQEHGPEDGLFVFLQSLTHCQPAVRYVTLLSMVDEFDNAGIVQIKTSELALGRDDLFSGHIDLDIVDVEVESVETISRD